MAVYPRTDPKTKKQRKAADGRPVWRLQVYVAGRSHETTFTGTRAEAKFEDARWRVELESAGGAPKHKGESPTLATFCTGPWASHARAHLGERTREARKFQVVNLCRHLGARKLTEIGTDAAERYQTARTSEGAEPGTVNTETSVLLSILSYARRKNIPAASPDVRQLPERKKKGKVKAWTRAECAALLAACETVAPFLLPILVFLLNTGCRKGEAIACETAWIDLGANVLRIEPNEDWQPKNGEPREVPIEPALRPWLERAAKGGRRYAFPPTKKKDGKPRERYACFPRRAFERVMEAAKMKGSPHKTRHTYASLFLAAGGSMFALSRILGHASIRTTEKVYSHMLPEALDGARGLVNLGPAVGPAKMEARKRWVAR
jgi:integrase